MFRPLSSVIHYIYDVIHITINPPIVDNTENSSGYTEQPGRDYIVLEVAPEAELTNWRKRVCVTKRS
jgi:hypothetical protein